MSYFFFPYRSLSLSLYTVFDSVSSNIDEVLLINPSVIVFVFGDFNVRYKDWLSYSGGSDRHGELLIFLSQMTLLRWLTFLLGSQTMLLTVLVFCICLFILMLVFVLQWLFVHREILIMLLSHFIQIHSGIPCFIASLWLFLCWLGWSLWSFERCSMVGYL